MAVTGSGRGRPAYVHVQSCGPYAGPPGSAPKLAIRLLYSQCLGCKKEVGGILLDSMVEYRIIENAFAMERRDERALAAHIRDVK